MLIDNVVVASLMIAFFWSLLPIFYKVILKDVPATTVFYMYYIIAFSMAMIFLLYNWDSTVIHLEKITIKDILLFITIVLLASVVANYLFYNILENNKAYLVSVLTAVSPIFTAVIAYLFLKESINVNVWIGIVITIIGLVMIVYYTH